MSGDIDIISEACAVAHCLGYVNTSNKWLSRACLGNKSYQEFLSVCLFLSFKNVLCYTCLPFNHSLKVVIDH